MRVARLYVAKRRAKPIVSADGSRSCQAAATSPSGAPRRVRAAAVRIRTVSTSAARRCSCRRQSSAGSGPSPSRGFRAPISFEVHEAPWTPFVTAPIGISESGASGKTPRQSRRETCAWSFETPFTREESLSPRTAIEKDSFGSSGTWRPSPRRSSNAIPNVSASFSKYRFMTSLGKRSIPAGTGVCVVKTFPAVAISRASANVRPRSARSWRIRSRPRNAACPSFAWRTVGLRPATSSARMPPIPRTSSWRIAHVLVPAVEAVRDLPVRGPVRRQVRVEEKQRRPPHPHAPDEQMDVALADPHRHDRRRRPRASGEPRRAGRADRRSDSSPSVSRPP